MARVLFIEFLQRYKKGCVSLRKNNIVRIGAAYTVSTTAHAGEPMQSYIILRDTSLAQFGPLRRRPDELEARVLTPPKIEIAEEQLSEKHVREVRHDRTTVAIAADLSTRLISPLKAEADAQTGPDWGIKEVGADKSSFTGKDVTVAVLDTGIDASHPAFQGVQLIEQDFTGSGNGDRQGHGTHCAGTIFGRDVNGTRIGVARGVTRALIGKVLSDDGRGRAGWMVRAINWALDNNADVISMSLGIDFPGNVKRLIKDGFDPEAAASATLEAYTQNLRLFDALMMLVKRRAAIDGGVIVVAATGNESNRPKYEIGVSLPAVADGIISIGALGKGASGLSIARFSNRPPVLSAPGVNITSAKAGGGLAALSGTSMACPHVAGLAALWWEFVRQSGLPATADTVFARLLASARRQGLDPKAEADDFGAGIAMAP